jgi:hypothetical protein
MLMFISIKLVVLLPGGVEGRLGTDSAVSVELELQYRCKRLTGDFFGDLDLDLRLRPTLTQSTPSSSPDEIRTGLAESVSDSLKENKENNCYNC